MDPTLRTAGGRHVLRLERRLAHPPEKVWRALTDPDQVAAWFPMAMRMELRAGAPIDFGQALDGSETKGEVVEVDPPRLLAFTWDDDLLRWELRPDGAGCLLVLDHTFDDRPAAASYGVGWQDCLVALAALLDGRPAARPGSAAEAWAGMHAAHEALVAALGLDQGAAEDTAGGWRVRFERQLTRPPGEVWALLAGGTAPPEVGGPVPAPATAAGVPAAAVSMLEAPALLTYGWRDGDRVAGDVRLELSDGPGAAARLVVTQTGPSDLIDCRATALTAWRTRIRNLSAELGGRGDPGRGDATGDG